MGGFFGRLAGFCLILFGLYAALLNHAFGSMIDPSVSDLEWWKRYLRSTWQGYLFCSALLLVGACFLFEYIAREKSIDPSGLGLD